MAENFKPVVWSKWIQTELKKDLILSNWCDFAYEGEFGYGKRVKIVGVERPKIQKYIPGQDLDNEHLGDNSQFLDITESDSFMFEVDDVDKAQSKPEYLKAQFAEAKYALADSADQFVGKLAADANSDMMSASTDLSTLTSFLDPINDAHIKLYKNNVSTQQELAADLTPEHIVGLRTELASLFTDNVEYVKRGAVGMFHKTYLRLSNNLYNDGTDDYEMVRTKKAIAFAGQIEKIETCRAEKRFASIIKGLHVYGAKLVRPKELYVIKVH